MTSQHSGPWTKRTLLLLACASLTWSGCQHDPKEPSGSEGPSRKLNPITPQGRDLRRFPPAVQTMTARKADAGHVILEVRFGPGEKLPTRLSIRPHDEIVDLNDEGRDHDKTAGDGLFSGRVALDLAKVDAAERKSPAPQEMPVFEGRSLRKIRRPEPLDLKRFEQGDSIPLRALSIDAAQVDIARSLMITDIGVVEDPVRTKVCAAPALGKWTFGHLMNQMANTPVSGIDPSDFVLRWLMHWEMDQVVNFNLVPKRPSIRTLVIDPWIQASGMAGKLDLGKAPFKLLAIVNRIDLADNLVYGGGSGGEARFVFGVVNPQQLDLRGCPTPLPFTVIFEYGIKKNSCAELKAWAQQWQDLSLQPVGTPFYNAALEAITDQFVSANADPSKPNGSALNQLRTNEIALAAPWELREFQVLASQGGHLGQVTVKQTPDLLQLANAITWVNLNQADIIDCKAQVPVTFPGATPFLAGSALVPPPPFPPIPPPIPPPGFFWNNPPPPATAMMPRDARQQFSLKTCNGCHAGETGTFFTHVNPASFGSAATLSGFLTGITVPDPADGAPSRTFNDLLNRQLRMAEILNTPCPLLLIRKPIRFVH